MPARPIDPAQYPSDVDPDVPNDSGMPASAVLLKLKADGVEMVYGDIKLLAQRSALAEAREAVASLAPEARQGIMFSIDRALRRNAPKVMKSTASKQQMDEFYNDLLLWTALKEQAEQ